MAEEAEVTRSIKVVVTALDKFINTVLRALVLDVTANLQRAPSEGGTPVDTGWARANWIPAIGQPVQQAAGSRENVSGAASQTGQAAVAVGYNYLNGPAHITNNVPYIVALNEGHSKQAPSGFVQRAIIKAITIDLPRKVAR